MKLIAPTIITDAMLVSTNVTEDDYSEWDESTDYVTNDYVIVTGSTHRIYKAVQPSGPGASPAGVQDPTADASETYWQNISATNRWKPFDNKTTVQASKESEINYTFDSLGLVDGVALFGLEASSARLVIENGSPATTVYDQTIDLTDTSVMVDWYSFLFEPVSTKRQLIFPDVPPYTAATYTLTLTSTGTVKVGQIVLGRSRNLGETIYGTGLGMISFSLKDRDDFGDAFIVQRGSSKTVDFRVRVLTGAADLLMQRLSERDALPTVYFAGDATDNFGTTVFGFFQDLNMVLEGPTKSALSIEIEELI
jgi:hypothetical protein